MEADYKNWIGRSQTQTDTVSRSSLERYKATLNYEVPHGVVPDGYHWGMCLPDTWTQELGADGHPPLGGFMPSLPYPRRMWASSEVEFLNPLEPAMRVERQSTIVSIEPKKGQSGELVFVGVEHMSVSEGVDLVRELQTIVYRDAPAEASPLPAIDDDLDIGAWDWTAHITPEATLLFRFSAITFNTHRIHYDQTYAQKVELYPDLVVHGPLTATLLLKLCADNLGHNQVSHFKFTAKSPLYRGQPLHLAGRETDQQIDLFAFGADGRVAMQAVAKRKNK